MAVDSTTSFVRKLAHNDASIRASAFEALQAYLKSKAAAKLDLFEMQKLWKGLYYAMWYCDKPIPQQSLAGDLGKLFSEVVPQEKLAIFHEAFWIILLKEWPTIDKWRYDKYLMLVRRVIRHQLFRLADNEWSQSQVDEFLAVLSNYPLANNMKFPQSLAYHVCDLYVDEIEYVIFKDFRDYSQEDDEDESLDDESESEETKPPAKETKSKLSEEEIALKKKEIVENTPLSKLITPFETLAATAKNKAMRTKCKEEVLENAKLVEWSVVNNKDESDSEDEWTGF